MSTWQSTNKETEQRLLADVSVDEAWALVERFSTLVRTSSSEGEREAARYLSERLQAWEVPHQILEPELYLSVPLSARVEVHRPGRQEFRAKTPAFSISTGPAGLTGEVVYVPQAPAGDMSVLYVPTFQMDGKDVAGKIVLAEGMSGPDEVAFFTERGSIGQIFINPGTRIHWSICTPIWGTPDLDTMADRPAAAVVDVNRPDGEQLIKLAEAGDLRVTLHTELREGWAKCPLVVAEVPGAVEPEKFVLVHGHLDSWDVGVGDNATGDAALLGLAQLLWSHRHDLKRSVRIAWWPGHSTGRYAGSTWYADRYALDLAYNCIAHMNIDSPGCRWADTYSPVCWMAELEEFAKQVIRDVTGKEAQGVRPYRAGDYSFNNIAVSGCFMLLSMMSDEKRQEMGYYPVGGCGGNIGWHTEDDVLEIADRQNLERDLRVYAAAISRLVNSPIYPLDFRSVADEHAATLQAYQAAAQPHFDLSPALQEVAALKAGLETFYGELEGLADCSPSDERVRRANRTLLALGRILVAANYTRRGYFRQDPAVAIEPLPDLVFATQIGAMNPESDAYRFCQTQLVRGQNRYLYALRQAQLLLQHA